MSLVVVTILWSSSRTSIAVTVAFALVLAAVGAFRSTAVRLRVLQMAIAVCLVVAVALPIVTKDPLAYTRRALIWQHALDYWSRSPIAGWGPDILSERNSLTRAVGGYPIHAHNIWLTVAVMGGVVALISVTALLGLLVYRASRMFLEGEALPFLFLVVLALVGIAEDPVRAFHIASMSYVVWGGLVLAMCAPGQGLTGTGSIGDKPAKVERVGATTATRVRSPMLAQA
jgi:O-antigen ligase